MIKDFYCRHGNHSLIHHLHFNHTTRNRHPGGQIIYDQNWIEKPHACSTHLILSFPQITWLHITWRKHYWQFVYWSVRLFNYHATISRRPSRKTGAFVGSLQVTVALLLPLLTLSFMSLHQFFHIRKWVKAIAFHSVWALLYHLKHLLKDL